MVSSIVDVYEDEAVIHIEKVDVGMSGFVIKKFPFGHSSIIAQGVVQKFDPSTKKATLKIEPYHLFDNESLPTLNKKVEKGDEVLLGFGYSRALLIAPTEEIYYKITKQNPNIKWIHPDIFATILSLKGHPTPLASDFISFAHSMFIGLIFIYVDKKLYMLDALSLQTLQTYNVPFQATTKPHLPFYTRVKKIRANWFGEGSSTLKAYKPYYQKLLQEDKK
ncbi:hypothetical protein MNB_SM-7-943 [hydrothermal vent metagenome]